MHGVMSKWTDMHGVMSTWTDISSFDNLSVHKTKHIENISNMAIYVLILYNSMILTIDDCLCLLKYASFYRH